MDILIEASSISVIRNDTSILEDVSLVIHRGDFITIIGPNGAGKTTLLQCLMGFFRSDLGFVNRSEGLRIGYVPQRFSANSTIPITVRRFLSLHKGSCFSDIKSVSDEVGILFLLDRQLSMLSGGELQRVLLARSLLRDPELLILDEPSQNLDISGQLGFYKLLDRIYTARHLSVLIVSHDLHMVMSSTRHVICLYRHICCSGSPQRVREDPAFISLFGSDMARLISFYQHSHTHSHDGDFAHDGNFAHDGDWGRHDGS